MRTTDPFTSDALDAQELRELDAHWRAANYLAVGQIYLMGNALLERPLEAGDIKPRLLGHWGTSPGLNLIHTHLNRIISAHDLPALCIWGPGHGGPAVLANSWLEGTYSEIYPSIGRDAVGMAKLTRGPVTTPGSSGTAPTSPRSPTGGGSPEHTRSVRPAN
ncbi:hypothetical protein OG707_40185 [Streptomyces sp. NBC_01465]|nr:hypothetical protein [Streptomyces sp. NBC_01465]